jgi:hypothetical protein
MRLVQMRALNGERLVGATQEIGDAAHHRRNFHL